LKKPTGRVTLSAQEGEAMLGRLSVYAPSRSDCEVLIEVVRWYFWLVWLVQEAKMSLQKVRMILFGHGPKPPELLSPEVAPADVSSSGDDEAGGAASSGDEDVGSSENTVSLPKPRGGHRPGTGRRGAAAYGGATRVECRHDELAVGQRCPVCGQGNLYALPAGVEIRIDGNALLSAMRYELEKLRCSACGEIFTAGLPEGAGDEKYSAQARAVLAVSRYLLGVPSYRLQGYQAMLGVPVPDATQWDQIELVGDCAYKVFAQMECEAAQGELIFQDDTAVRILSLMQENRALFDQAKAQGLSAPKERTGLHTTALAVQVGESTAILYYSSRRHAGENLQGLLDKREVGLAKPLAMSDALSSNDVVDESMLIRCHCLAHGRRKFSDLEAVFPHECQVVLDVISQVFDHDEQAREAQLSPEARLAYHQAQSPPLMDELKRWLDEQIDAHLVEPNSSLGKAIGDMRTHWPTLTRFSMAA
jgi:transposase